MAVAQETTVRAILSLSLVMSFLSGSAYADRLANVTEIARGGYQAPRFAPSGRELAVTGPKLRGLFVVALASGAVQRINDEEAAGVHARYLADGRLALRVRRAGLERDVAIDRHGAERALVTPSLAETRNDRLYVRGLDGATRQVGAGDRFFAPLPSPDGSKIAVQGLATGLWIYDRAADRLSHVGRGTAPAWSPDGAALVFERTEDDGHDIVAADLFLYRVGEQRVVRLTATADRLERRPSVSPDGRRIAFDDGEGSVFVADLTGGQP
jgi:hypothetical protein